MEGVGLLTNYVLFNNARLHEEIIQDMENADVIANKHKDAYYYNTVD